MSKRKNQDKSAKTKPTAAELPANAGYGANDPKLDDLAKNTEDSAGEYLTTNQGVRINDNQNSLKAGDRGPTLLEDFILREKITHFDHERIPERVVHARGSAAHGYFQVYESMAEYTKASFLQDPAVKTPVFVRFSTVAGSRGSTDLARDVRGFAVKFYTQEGNFDLVGNNIPVFFIQDAIKFPDLVHAVKAGTAQRNSAGCLGARHLLGLHLADAGIDAHDYVGDVGSGDSQKPAHDGRLRRSHFPLHQRARQSAVCKVSLEAAAGFAFRRLGRSAEDLR